MNKIVVCLNDKFLLSKNACQALANRGINSAIEHLKSFHDKPDLWQDYLCDVERHNPKLIEAAENQELGENIQVVKIESNKYKIEKDQLGMEWVIVPDWIVIKKD